MGRPVPEIQRSRTAHLERVAISGDVVHVQFGAAMDQPLHGRRLELRQGIRVRFNAVEKFRVPNAGHLHGFYIAVALVACGQGGEQLEIINHCKWRGKGADEILFTEGINPVLYAHARIILAERCGGNANVADTAVSRGGGQAHHVQQRASADTDHIGMTVDVVAIHL